MSRITIKYDPDLAEYQVPGLDPASEAQRYYTGDRSDAIDTARVIHGAKPRLHIRTMRLNVHGERV